LRDDRITGGTKRRGLSLLLSSSFGQKPMEKIYYAGTTMGHGALALAHACKDNGKIAEIFICADSADPMIEKLRNAGAHVHIRPPMPVTSLYALTVEEAKGQTVFPPGFDMPEFETALAESLSVFDVSPYSEIWAVSVTGTLTRALKRAFPDKPFKTASVVKSGAPCDFTAPEKYHQPAKSPPPYPSCPYTDAKLWQFAVERAAPDALIWNTAG
jgi:hypothetical protein